VHTGSRRRELLVATQSVYDLLGFGLDFDARAINNHNIVQVHACVGVSTAKDEPYAVVSARYVTTPVVCLEGVLELTPRHEVGSGGPHRLVLGFPSRVRIEEYGLVRNLCGLAVPLFDPPAHPLRTLFQLFGNVVKNGA
jgi:hypothetical protein